MLIGVPTEIKDHECRVALTPEGAHALCGEGHGVLVQRGAGARVGLRDEDYAAAGARLAGDAADIWARAELMVKVKELQPAEYACPRPGQAVFCYQHLATEPDRLEAALASGASFIAYETVADDAGRLPLLAPMSVIAGRMAPQVGAWALQLDNGGSGVLLGGAPDSAPAHVVVAGTGNVGAAAADVAAGMGARVTVFARSASRLAQAAALSPQGRIAAYVYSPADFEQAVADADLVIGAVLVPGRLSPKLISRALLRRMRPGSVLVEVGIDQGGISHTARPTSHSQPLYVEEGVVHYCVPNMPAVVARTATFALAAAVLPYVHALARHGLRGALVRDAGLRQGLQAHAGGITHEGLARDTGRPLVAW